MSLITIDPEKCNHDGLCVQACPVNVIKQEKGCIPYVDQNLNNCIRCGHCVTICPKEALTHSLIPQSDFRPVPEELPNQDLVEALLLSRRSTRGFKHKPVPHEKLQKLIEVARCAPTASNNQKVYWSMIEDAERLGKVKELTLQWIASNPKRAYHIKAAKEGRDVVLRGGTALAVVYSPEEYLWTESDCAIALTYMELLATSMNIGVCWGGLVTIASRHVHGLKEILGVPEDHKIGGAMMLGLPSQKHHLIPPRNKARINWL